MSCCLRLQVLYRLIVLTPPAPPEKAPPGTDTGSTSEENTPSAVMRREPTTILFTEGLGYATRLLFTGFCGSSYGNRLVNQIIFMQHFSYNYGLCVLLV